MKVIEVVAAVIYNDKNQILIARRSAGKSLPGKWEFPGGKVELGETHNVALQRELQEEMNILTKVERFIGSNKHHYENWSIHLYAYKTIYISGEIKLIDHDMVHWVKYEDLESFDFAEADIPLLPNCKPV